MKVRAHIDTIVEVEIPDEFEILDCTEEELIQRKVPDGTFVRCGRAVEEQIEHGKLTIDFSEWAVTSVEGLESGNLMAEF